MLTFVEVAVGENGGVRCTRCAPARAAATFRKSDDVLADVASAVAAWPDGPGPNVVLTGAEPFAHPELPALVTAAVRAGVRRLALDTDAVALSVPGNAPGCVSAGVRHLTFTLLGGSPGVHDVLAGSSGAFDAALGGVAAYRAAASSADADVCVVATVSLCRHNAQEAPGAVAAAVRAGAQVVRVRIVDGTLDVMKTGPWLAAACDTGLVNGIWVEVEGVPFCLLPSRTLHVASCVREVAGAKPPTCGECPLDAVCGGGVAEAAANVLATFRTPPDADSLAPAVARARGMVTP